MNISNPIRIGIIGVGKIARDQHLPALAANQDFELVAAASRHGRVDGVDNFDSIEELLQHARVDAVSLCMPPTARFDAARVAIQSGKHVFMEKPPGGTVSEVETLKSAAAANGVSLFASWHSRYAPAVEAAREFLASSVLKSADIVWREDVRRWHPGQAWIWEPGGFGVFDPGINALSIATHIFPPLRLLMSTLEFPKGRLAPIAAGLGFVTTEGASVSADFDWRQAGPQTWDIRAATDKGELVLSSGGAKLAIDGNALAEQPEREYPALYERFAELIRSGQSDVDLAPLQHVADAFMLGRRIEVEAFEDDAIQR